MIRSIIKRDLHINHRKPGNYAIFQCFANAILYRFNIFFGHYAANNGIDKIKAFAALVRGYSDPHVAILPMPASLPDMFALSLGFACDRLTVSNLWATHVCLNLKLAEEPIYNHFQVQFTHTINDGLAGFYIGMQLESRILLRQLIQRNCHFILVSTCPWLDGDLNDRLWKDDRLQDDRMLSIAQCIAREGVAQAYGSTNVTRTDFIDILAMIRVHTQQAPDTFRLILGAILNSRTFRQRTRIDTQIRQAPNKRIRNNLEDQRTKRCRIIYLARNCLICIRIDALWSWNIKRRRQIGNHSIQHCLHALVLQR